MEEKFEKLDRGEKDCRSTDSIYNYLDWLTALPWGECRFAILFHMFMIFLGELYNTWNYLFCSNDNFDILRAEKILDEDHYGLRDVKERILEFIAVGELTGNPEGRLFAFLVHSLFIYIVKLNS